MVRSGSQGEPILLEIIFLSVTWNIIRIVEEPLLSPSEVVSVKSEVIALLPRVASHDLAIPMILEVTASVLRPLRVWSEVIVLFVHLLWLVLMLLVQRGVAIATDPVIFVLVI
jgi:hypothetical protein